MTDRLSYDQEIGGLLKDKKQRKKIFFTNYFVSTKKSSTFAPLFRQP